MVNSLTGEILGQQYLLGGSFKIIEVDDLSKNATMQISSHLGFFL
jgi:hypothetical protein